MNVIILFVKYISLRFIFLLVVIIREINLEISDSILYVIKFNIL